MKCPTCGQEHKADSKWRPVAVGMLWMPAIVSDAPFGVGGTTYAMNNLGGFRTLDECEKECARRNG